MKLFALLVVLCAMLGAVLSAVVSNTRRACSEELGKVGTCHALIERWTYRQDTNECITFYYSGCHGNNNQFHNKRECEKTCKK